MVIFEGRLTGVVVLLPQVNDAGPTFSRPAPEAC
jgi:hypothetical protein